MFQFMVKFQALYSIFEKNIAKSAVTVRCVSQIQLTTLRKIDNSLPQLIDKMYKLRGLKIGLKKITKYVIGQSHTQRSW